MGWWKTAKPGDKVVCVRASGNVGVGHISGRPFAADNPLVLNRVYTILDLVEAPADADGVGVALLEEPYFLYGPRRFRPVAKRSSESGVEALKAYLKKKQVADLLTTPSWARAGEL